MQMQDVLVNYLKEPSPETFAELRDTYLATEGLNPFADDLDDIDDLLEQGRFKEADELIKGHLWPNYFLSPGAHLRLAVVKEKLGNEQEAEFEQVIASALMEGILTTGSGTKDSPIKITRISDQYDFLMAENKGLAGRKQIEEDGRAYEVLTLKEGGEVWFELTDMRKVVDRLLSQE